MTTGDLAAAFHRAHRERYGYAQEQSEIEIVSARLRSFGLVEKLGSKKIVARQSETVRKVIAHLDGRTVERCSLQQRRTFCRSEIENTVHRHRVLGDNSDTRRRERAC